MSLGGQTTSTTPRYGRITLGPPCARHCAPNGGSGAPAPRLPVTFCDEPGRLRATTHDRRLPMSRMLLRVPDGCGADRRFVLALRPVCSISRTTALAWHDAGLSLDWASPVTWIWRAAQGATRLGRDSYQAVELLGTAQTAAPKGSCTRRQAPDRPRATTASCWPLAGYTSLPSPLVRQPR